MLIYGLGIPSGLGPFVLSIKPIYNMGHVVDSSVDVNAEVNSFLISYLFIYLLLFLLVSYLVSCEAAIRNN